MQSVRVLGRPVLGKPHAVRVKEAHLKADHGYISSTERQPGSEACKKRLPASKRRPPKEYNKWWPKNMTRHSKVLLSMLALMALAAVCAHARQLKDLEAPTALQQDFSVFSRRLAQRQWDRSQCITMGHPSLPKGGNPHDYCGRKGRSACCSGDKCSAPNDSCRRGPRSDITQAACCPE